MHHDVELIHGTVTYFAFAAKLDDRLAAHDGWVWCFDVLEPLFAPSSDHGCVR